MANSSYSFREVRFVIEPELTQCYVLLDVAGDSPIGVAGWHHKTFPASRPLLLILQSFEFEAPVLWATKAPQE